MQVIILRLYLFRCRRTIVKTSGIDYALPYQNAASVVSFVLRNSINGKYLILSKSIYD